jgi:phosphoglycolate phosphatase
MPFGARIEAVIIDLDGTLLDTVPDLADAANRMLGELGFPGRAEQEIASFVGRGIENLVARSIGAAHAVDPAALARALAVFNRHYAAVSGVHSRVFPGVREGLAALHAQGLQLACITNKAERFTLPLLEQMDLRSDFALIVSGDSLPRKKPDPLPLIHVCGHFGVMPDAALMIGDSPNDAQAARAAGCPVACVPYGYREGLEVRELDCDVIVSTLAEAASLIQRSNSHYAAA